MTALDKFRDILSSLRQSEGASTAEVEKIEAAIGFEFPIDYVEFIRSTNGFGAFVGDGIYLMIYDLSSLLEIYDIRRTSRLGDYILIGSDGGDRCFGYVRDQPNPRIVEVSGSDPDLGIRNDIGSALDDLFEFARKWRY